MHTPVYITSISSVSPLGNSSEVFKKYKNTDHYITSGDFNGKNAFAAFLPKELKEEIFSLKNSSVFSDLDDSVLYAVFAAREAVEKSGWTKGDNIGINIGSSRGATGLFEKFHEAFLKSGKAEVLSSPSTTLGNISSWVAQDLQTSGPEISHSVTCSTGLHAVLNAVAWIKAGLTEEFIAGGSEAALTPFTIAQMQAMKIYASEDLDFPCQALNMQKTRNSMVLGEAAGIACISANKKNALAQIYGIGYATEKLKHSVSISADAECLQRSMKMAISEHDPGDIDVIVLHAPGTLKGDLAEVNAVKKVFGNKMPAITTNKWKIGHTFGASGILSLEMAVLMLQHQEFIPVPFSQFLQAPKKIRNVLVNAVGFGGNAVSILIGEPL